MAVPRGGALAILFVMPLFFSSNLVFGRAAIDEVGPFTLAFLRWSLTALVLAVVGRAALVAHGAALRRLSARWFAMAFLGMWVCGALVYWALVHTTATNGTLIYTASPVLIVVIEGFRGRRVANREIAGIALAIVGIVAIVARGRLDALFSLGFNVGDLVFVATAVSWAAYSVLLKAKCVQAVPTVASFCVLSAAGAILLLPFAVLEWPHAGVPVTTAAWWQVAGIVVFSSLLPFSAYQMGVRVVGPSLTGVFLYLLPVYGVAMAVLFLGEELRTFHVAGITLVLGGVVLATFPTSALSRVKARRGMSAP